MQHIAAAYHTQCSTLLILLFFFFQAEDGIRDVAVTGVQTCALPIFRPKIYYDSQTALVCLENTHNMAGGTLYTAPQIDDIDRKSTRLNSSHGYISYAVFCLKKKKKKKDNTSKITNIQNTKRRNTTRQ